ncbi:MAG: antitoxin [Thermoflexales bacterium]
MKTTIEIPDTLYRKAKIRAVERGESLKDLFLSALQRELAEEDKTPVKSPELDRPDLYTLNPQGFAVLKRKRNETNVVTNTWVNKMREEMGI